MHHNRAALPGEEVPFDSSARHNCSAGIPRRLSQRYDNRDPPRNAFARLNRDFCSIFARLFGSYRMERTPWIMRLWRLCWLATLRRSVRRRTLLRSVANQPNPTQNRHDEHASYFEIGQPAFRDLLLCGDLAVGEDRPLPVMHLLDAKHLSGMRP